MKGKFIPLIQLRTKETDAVIEQIFISLKEIYDDSSFVLGKVVEVFEERFASLVGCRYAIGVNSGLDALLLALRTLEIGPGDEVITVPNSFVATAAAIHLVGARPVFIDVRDDFNLDPKLLQTALTKRTKAIIPVHLTGNPCEMDTISEFAKANRLHVIEDAAQAIGATYRGRPVGSWGDIGCFSLHPLKNLHVWGDGGMITTNNHGLAEQIKKARNHGLVNRDICEFFSYNSRLDSIQAAVGLVALAQLEKVTERRRRNAKWYDQNLDKFVSIPHFNTEDSQPVYHVYQIRTNNRERLADFLLKNGIETKIHYPVPIHLQPCCSRLGYRMGDFRVSERLAKTILSLPIRESLEMEELMYVSESIRNFFRNEKTSREFGNTL